MKVLYVATAFARDEKDVITPWLTKTILFLREQGVDVEVFTSSYKGLGNQKVFGIPVWRFRYFFSRWEDLTHEEAVIERLKKGIRYKFLLPLYIIFGSIGIYRLLRVREYDIIHIHWPFPHIIFGAVGKFLFRKKIISSFYGVEIKWVRNKMPYFLPLLKWALSISDIITALSRYTSNEIKKVLDRNVEIIPFSTHFEMKNSFKKTSNNMPVILFVGRLVERKGVRYLIEAFNKILQVYKAQLFIVGGGPERGKLEEMVNELGIKGSVKFPGVISDEELDKLYRKADVFVLPACFDSRGDTEGLGVVLIEAMSYEIPVIASNVGGILDIVKDRETGILVPEKNSEKLSGAIIYLLENKKFAERLGKQGKKFIKKNFSWENIINHLITLYKNME